MIMDKISGIVTSIKGQITISTVWYFNQSPPVSHTTGNSYRSPHSGRTHPNMAYGYHDLNESDQITSVPDVTIVYIILLC